MGQHFSDMRAVVQAAGARPLAGIAAGARIATRRGLVMAGELAPGDQVLTRDSGYRPVRQILPLGLLRCAGLGHGLWLHPDHGVLRRDVTGQEVLVPARQLPAPDQQHLARYLVLSVALDRHEILCAEGNWIESAPFAGGIPARPRADALPASRPDAMRTFRVADGSGRA